MTGKETRELLDAMAFALSPLAKGKIKFSSKVALGNGFTNDINDGKQEYIIGVKGLKNNSIELDDHIAMLPVMTLLHEVCGHGGQFKYTFQNDTPISRVLALNDFACRSSLLYYRGPNFEGDETQFTPQYSRQPIELAAEYMALKAAHDYLSTAYSEETSERMLLAYVNTRGKAKVSFIPKMDDYEHLEDVFQAFENNFEKCINKTRRYNDEDDPEGPLQTEHKKYNRIKAILHPEELSEEQLEVFRDCELGTHQDLMMCSAFYHKICDVKDEIHLIRDNMGVYHKVSDRKKEKATALFALPVFQNFDWNLDKIFTPIPPKNMIPSCTIPSELRLERLYNMMDSVKPEDKVASRKETSGPSL